MSTIRNNVLIIDDNGVNNFICQNLVENYLPTCSVMVLESSTSSLEYLSDHHQDTLLIFLDLQMPVLDGWDVLDSIQKAKISAPVAIITSSIQPEDEQKVQNYQEILDFIVKPLTADKIQKSLDLTIAKFKT